MLLHSGYVGTELETMMLQVQLHFMIIFFLLGTGEEAVQAIALGVKSAMNYGPTAQKRHQNLLLPSIGAFGIEI